MEPIPLSSYGFLLLDVTNENESVFYKFREKTPGKTRRKENFKKPIMMKGNPSEIIKFNHGREQTKPDSG